LSHNKLRHFTEVSNAKWQYTADEIILNRQDLQSCQGTQCIWKNSPHVVTPENDPLDPQSFTVMLTVYPGVFMFLAAAWILSGKGAKLPSQPIQCIERGLPRGQVTVEIRGNRQLGAKSGGEVEDGDY